MVVLWVAAMVAPWADMSAASSEQMKADGWAGKSVEYWAAD
jgi:hypothetical protein